MNYIARNSLHTRQVFVATLTVPAAGFDVCKLVG